jgi:hypothetical protein
LKNLCKLDYFYKFKNNCHSGWVDLKWHNNKQIRNIDYFFDVSCENHFNDIDCLDYFVFTGSQPRWTDCPGQAPDKPVVLGKNVKTNVVTINQNNFSSVSSVDISKMDYFESCDVKSNNISQMDYFHMYDKSCVKSSNLTIFDQCIEEFCNINVSNNTIDDLNYFSVPVYDAVEGCNLTGFGFRPHTDIHTYASPSGGRVQDVQDLFDLGKVLRQGRVCNFQQKIKSLDTHINVDRLRDLTEHYYDKQVIDLIEFGFPLDMDKTNFIASNLVEYSLQLLILLTVSKNIFKTR